MTSGTLMDEDTILVLAAEIHHRRQVQAKRAAAAETTRLFKRYAKHLTRTPHGLGPDPLSVDEALLLAALQRNKFIVSAERGQTRWHGDATCAHHLRDGAIVMMATSREDLLWNLWAAISGQTARPGLSGRDAGIRLEEEHLKGSVVQADLRRLNAELREQERAGSCTGS